MQQSLPIRKKGRRVYHDLGTATGAAPTPVAGFPPAAIDPFQQVADEHAGLAPNPRNTSSQSFQQPPAMAPGAVEAPMAPNTTGQPYPQLQPRPGPGPGPVQTQGKVDPSQIPSIPRARDVAAEYYLTHVYPTMERHLPPPSTIAFTAHDQGNSSPKYARLTLNSIPATADLLQSTALPLGMVLQPLAALDPGEGNIPVIDFGDAGPPRCTRCRTYINPFMTFRSGGNKFICNMCTFPNDVPTEYYAPLDPAGNRLDRLQRPELLMGTVEYVVPKEYWSKSQSGLRWLFVVDVSQEAVSRGFLDACCQGILSALYGEDLDTPESGDEESSAPRTLPEGSKIGIITFDKDVYFYNLSPRLEQAQMMVMTDIEDPFVPLNEGLFVDPYESKHVITSLLSQLPTYFSTFKNPEPALLSTLNAALLALEETGGKIICSLSGLPTWGTGRLFIRDSGRPPSSDAEKKLLTTDHPEWKKTAKRLADSGVGVDLFVGAGQGVYLDLATSAYPTSITGGETFYYPNFHSPRDCLKLSSEIKHSITRETGYQAMLKVRCSNGLQVSAYHGNFLQHVFHTELELGSIDADKTIGVLFSHDGKLDPQLDAHFQTALLYTTASGERRVRCINIVAAVNSGGMDTMRSLDQDAIVNIIAKEAASRIPEKLPKDVRTGITEKAVQILALYRKNFSQTHPPGQLVLPDNLKEFAMFMLCLIKSRALKAGYEPSDRRVHDIRMLKTFSCTELSLYLYPRIIPIHNLQPGDGFASEALGGQLQMPPSMRASFANIEQGGAYIVDNGQQCLIWIHKDVSPLLLEDLFGPGMSELRQLDPQTSALPALDSFLNTQVRNILAYIATVRGSKAVTIQLARQGLDGAEFEFARMLAEDRNNDTHSYVDWLVHLHRSIHLELGSGKLAGGGGAKNEELESSALRPPYW